ncbi:MAG: transcriptional activator of cad operon [Alteromonadaceae bacterium]
MIDKQWVINGILFSETKQTLLIAKKTIQLEFRQSEVLAYFCRHINQQISRDELLKHVWQGQIVTDNAINRVIAKLRKSLGDDASNAKFIQTLPRKGYKFIAQTERIEVNKSSINIPKKQPLFWLILSLLILLLMLGYWASFTYKNERYTNKHVSALTRNGGMEDDATISPDGKYLLYRSQQKTWQSLFLKNLVSGVVIQLSDNFGDVVSGRWSTDSKKVIFIYNNKSLCQIKEVSLIKKQSPQNDILHNCPLGSYGRVAYSHHNDKIIYSEKQTGNEPYLLYSLNLKNSYLQKLNQPPTFNGGHIFFDLHPTENKLLVSTPDKQQWHAFYLLDLDTNKFTYLFNKDEYICCAIFNHQGDKIVVMGAHPNESLVEMDFSGNHIRTIFKASHLVSPAKRIKDTDDYIYSGSLLNIDISFYNFSTGKNEVIIDSSVVDRLPTISSDQTHLAYISRESNTAQVWLYDIEKKIRKQLTQFLNHHYYQDLQFSPDGSKLSVLMQYGIKTVDSKTGVARLVKIPQQVVRGLSWFDSKTLSFSLEIQGKWRVHHYNLNTDNLTVIDHDWAYIKYEINSKESAFINQDNKLFINDHHIKNLAFNMIDYHRIFNFEVNNNHLYFWKNTSTTVKIFKKNIATFEQEQMLINNLPGKLSITAQGIYFTHLKNQSSDIFKTIDVE